MQSWWKLNFKSLQCKLSRIFLPSEWEKINLLSPADCGCILNSGINNKCTENSYGTHYQTPFQLLRNGFASDDRTIFTLLQHAAEKITMLRRETAHRCISWNQLWTTFVKNWINYELTRRIFHHCCQVIAVVLSQWLHMVSQLWMLQREVVKLKAKAKASDSYTACLTGTIPDQLCFTIIGSGSWSARANGAAALIHWMC